MGHIRQLSENLANKIAAGEVVERPASVIKELTENSIDAKAKSITILVEQGGTSSMSVIDDGIGMNRTDALLCFSRHATSKIVDENDFAVNTPERRFVWCIQTPQVFETALIRHAYFKLMENEENETGITDDAMVVERMENCAVKLVEGSYENIKITTPEDLILAESLIKKRN